MVSAVADFVHQYTRLHRPSSINDNSNKSTDDVLPAIEDGQRRMFGKNLVRVCRVTINRNENSPTNFNIRYLYRPKEEKNLYDVRKLTDNNMHVKISRIQRSDLQHFNTNIGLFTLKAKSREKNTANVNGLRPNKKLPDIFNGNVINQEIRHVTSRETAAHVKRTPMVADTNKDSNQKVIASKPMVTRLTRDMHQNKLHSPVKHIPANDKNHEK